MFAPKEFPNKALLKGVLWWRENDEEVHQLPKQLTGSLRTMGPQVLNGFSMKFTNSWRIWKIRWQKGFFQINCLKRKGFTLAAIALNRHFFDCRAFSLRTFTLLIDGRDSVPSSVDVRHSKCTTLFYPYTHLLLKLISVFFFFFFWPCSFWAESSASISHYPMHPLLWYLLGPKHFKMPCRPIHKHIKAIWLCLIFWEGCRDVAFIHHYDLMFGWYLVVVSLVCGVVICNITLDENKDS